MKMNCNPVPTVDERINDIRSRTAEIVNDDILPNEQLLWAARHEGESMEHRKDVAGVDCACERPLDLAA